MKKTYLRIIKITLFFPFLISCNSQKSLSSQDSLDNSSSLESESHAEEAPLNLPYRYSYGSTSLFSRIKINQVVPGLYYNNRHHRLWVDEIAFLEGTLEHDFIGHQKDGEDILLPILVGRRFFKELNDGSIEYYGERHYYDQIMDFFTGIDSSYFFILQTIPEEDKQYWPDYISGCFFDENGNGFVPDKEMIPCVNTINLIDDPYSFLRMKDNVLQEDIVIDFIRDIHGGTTLHHVSDYWTEKQFPSGIKRDEVESRIIDEISKASILDI